MRRRNAVLLAMVVCVLACSKPGADTSDATGPFVADPPGTGGETADAVGHSDPPGSPSGQGGEQGDPGIAGGSSGATMDSGLRPLDAFFGVLSTQQGNLVFVATTGGRLTAVDLGDPAAPRVHARTWTDGAPQGLVVLGDTLVSVEVLDARGARARTRIAAWATGGQLFPAPSVLTLAGPPVAVLSAGDRLLVATIEGAAPGGTPQTVIRSFGRTAPGRVEAGEPRSLPHFVEGGDWVAPRLVLHDTALWVSSPRRTGEAWQTRFDAFDAADRDLSALPGVAGITVDGVLGGPAAVSFGPEGFACLTAASPGYYAQGPVRFHRVSTAGGTAAVASSFEWPDTAGAPVRGPLLLTPRRAFMLRGADPDGPATLSVLDVSPPGEPVPGGHVDLPAPFLTQLDGDRFVGVSHLAEDDGVHLDVVDTTDVAAPALEPARDLPMPPGWAGTPTLRAVNGRLWVLAEFAPCECSDTRRTRVFSLADGGDPAFVDLEGSIPRLEAWVAGRLVAAGAVTSVLDAGAVSRIGAVTLSVPVASALRLGDEVVRLRADPAGLVMDRVPLGAPDAPAADGVPFGPDEAPCTAPCPIAPALLSAAEGVVAHTWRELPGEVQSEYFERYETAAAGRAPPVLSGWFDLDAEGLSGKGSGRSGFSAGVALQAVKVQGRGADATYTGHLVVVDLRSGTAPAPRLWRLAGDDQGPILADGDQLATSHSEPEGERLAFWFDRFDYSALAEPIAAAPVNVPGRVLAYDHAAGRLLAAEYVQRAGGEETRLHAVGLQDAGAVVRATTVVDGMSLGQVMVRGDRLVAARRDADGIVVALVVVEGWQAGEAMAVREVPVDDTHPPVSEVDLAGDLVVLRGREGLLLVDLRSDPAELREIPLATPPIEVRGDERALLVSLGEPGMRVISLAP